MISEIANLLDSSDNQLSVAVPGIASQNYNGNLVCKSNKWNLEVGKGQDYINHLANDHPNYRPLESTLNVFGCTRCSYCKNTIQVLGHICSKNKKKKSELILPGKQNYESVIDVSWTVTLIGYDMTLPVYNRLCEIIDDYFEQGIACLERGTREHRLHIQCTGTLYYTNNEKSVKDLGLEFRRELMM